MNIVVLAAALFAGSFVEYMTPAWRLIGYAEPPVVLSIVIYYALNRSCGLMIAAAVAGGIICDALESFPPGTSVACLCLIGAVVRGFREVVFIGRWATHMFFGAAGAAGYGLGLFSILAMCEPVFREAGFSRIAAKIAGMCLLGALVTPLIFRLMRWLDVMMGNIKTVEPE